MARDQRTRLNAELAHQYGADRKKGGATPGRSGLPTGLTEGAEGELEEQVEAEAEGDVEAAAPVAKDEPKKSLFNLPRKEPSRQPLLGSSETLAPPAAPAAPVVPPASNKPRR